MAYQSEDSRVNPITFFLGNNALKLYKKLAGENSIDPLFFLIKLLVREGRAEATTLTGDKLKERLELIDKVNDELVDLINNPPKGYLVKTYVDTPRATYSRVWAARKRLASRGWSEEDIHNYCLSNYGVDYNFKKTPKKNPTQYENWQKNPGGKRK